MAWSRTFEYMKADLGVWTGVDKSYTEQNLIRLPADVRGMIVNQVRREIALRRDLHYFEATTYFDTADGDVDYGVASDFLRPYQVWWYDDNNDIRYLTQLSRSDWRKKYSNDESDEDEPLYFCYYGDQFYLAPVPDTVYRIYYDYYRLPTSLSANSDYDDFLVEGYDVILWESCKRACGYLMENTRIPLFNDWATMALHYLDSSNQRATYSAGPIQSEMTGD